MATQTDNYNLDLYETGDAAALTDQYNSAMHKIDNDLKTLNQGVTSANQIATNAKKTADANTAKLNALGATDNDTATALKNKIDTTTTTANQAKTTANDAVSMLNTLGITDNDTANTSKTMWDNAASLAANNKDDIATINNKLNNINIINVKDFGAKGDGQTDDTSAIKSAIDYAKNWPGNCFIIIPGGRYIISSTINIEPYMHIKGISVPVLQYNGAVGEALTISWTSNTANISKDSYYNIQPWQVSDVLNGISLYGNGSGTGIRIGNTTPTSVDDTNWYNVARSCFNNITVANFATGIQITPYNNFLNRFNHIHVEKNDTNIAFGGESFKGATNYGECFVISESTIGQATTGIMFNQGNFDVYLDKCGLDFCTTIVKENNDYGNHLISISRCNLEGMSYIYQGRESTFTTLVNLYDNIILFYNTDANAMFKTAPPISHANVHVGNNTIVTGGKGQYNDFVDENCLVDKTGYSTSTRRNAYAMISTLFNRVEKGNNAGETSFTSDTSTAEKATAASEFTKYGVTSEVKTTVATGSHCYLYFNDKFNVSPGEILRATILLKISTTSNFSINFSIKWYYNDTQVSTSAYKNFNIDASPDARYYSSTPIVVPSGVNKASIDVNMWTGSTDTTYEIGKIIVQ